MPATIVSSRKRKQTEEMEISPPKRVTRARAAARAPSSSATTSKSIKSSSADLHKVGKMATGVSKGGDTTTEVKMPTKSTGKRAVTGVLQKRKIKETIKPLCDDEEFIVGGSAVTVKSAAPIVKSRGRSKKATQELPSEFSGPEEPRPRPRGRPPKAKNTEPPTVRPKSVPEKHLKARVAAKAASTAERSDLDSDSDDDELAGSDVASRNPIYSAKSVGQAKATRGKVSATSIRVTAPSTRAAAASRTSRTASRATSATASTTARTVNVAGSRHVKFSDEAQDKENRPVSRGNEGRESKFTISTGALLSKSIRKATTVTSKIETATLPEEAKPQKISSAKPSDEERPKTPLSPKKIDQVAKGNGSGASPVVDRDLSSEDELSGATAVHRSPTTRPLQKSPTRPPPSVKCELTFSSTNVPSPVKVPQVFGASRPRSRDGLSLAQDPESLLSRAPARPPASPMKSIAQSHTTNCGSNEMPTSQEGRPHSTEQRANLITSPAKRPPVSLKQGRENHSNESNTALVPVLHTSPLKKAPLSARRLKYGEMEEDTIRMNLLQSPARRPRTISASTAIPQEKKCRFPFGDEQAQSTQLRAFKFSAVTPRRIRALKPSQRLLDDIAESGEMYATRSKEQSPLAIDDGDAEGDISMLDVLDDRIIYTPSKKRTTLFDSPLATRSRSTSPQKSIGTTQAKSTIAAIAPSLDPLLSSTGKTSRILFRENTEKHEDFDEDSLIEDHHLPVPLSKATPRESPIATPRPEHQQLSDRRTSRKLARESIRMTPLAQQFSAWLASSVENTDSENGDTAASSRDNLNGTFQAEVKMQIGTKDVTVQSSQADMDTAETTTLFNDGTVHCETNESTSSEAELNIGGTDAIKAELITCATEIDGTTDRGIDNSLNVFPRSANGRASSVEIYVDESPNLVDPVLKPVPSPLAGREPTLMKLENDGETSSLSGEAKTTRNSLTTLATPSRAARHGLEEILTVSKVPLKPADSAMNSSPTKAIRKSSTATVNILQEIELRDVPSPDSQDENALTEPVAAEMQDENTIAFDLQTPLRTPRTGADARILRGAVVYVDVHTTEGADASGLFVELLCQMGARCVKQWAWKPRSSAIGGETPGGSKVGITHVIFKDGSKRTLEKVREAHGLVSCVGVGWVLDCERHNRWLDEASYTIDPSIIPRGGHNRRKSMEPKALENINGTLKAAQATPRGSSHRRSTSTPAATSCGSKDLLDFTQTPGPAPYSQELSGNATPTIRGLAFDTSTPTIRIDTSKKDSAIFRTPTSKILRWNLGLEDSDLESNEELPETPYFMSEGAKLVQATCPPKQQTGRSIFPVSGRIEEVTDEEIRRRLEVARRRSMQWAPRIGSPLRRD